MTHIIPGIYSHYKHHDKLYRVHGIGMHSETLEPHVIYESLYDDDTYPQGTFWLRPLTMFTETVIHHDREVPRFTYRGTDLSSLS
ncbi:MAG: DUF1653 domain-containing protein [Candidatus Pacebacteria bacterium]|nr:DUF1653 domain-containing protein [Candidatus Paceibacterota bacterium]MCD8528079.1 DUF1653 domain-containing protein [Candidatus Paceibacterota bacterium]MCD8564036.1 DUF1653 domain-containing protein [Candidatus Paceibacterota bacterium]